MADSRTTTDQTRPSIAERTESYRLWRERLAAIQADTRRSLEEDPGPELNPMWSPQALFADSRDGSTVHTD